MPYRAGTRYHTQDKGHYCGAAVAMMLFEHLSIGGNTQDSLYEIGRSLSEDKDFEYIDPVGLKRLLNKRLAEKGHPAPYVLQPCATGEEAVQELAASLAQNPTLPGFTLIGTHWVLIDGIEQQSDAAGTRTERLLIHEPILDPVNAVNKDPTPPHNADDACGSKGHGYFQAAYTAKAWSDILAPQEKFGGVPLVIVPPPAGAPRFPLAEEDDAQSPLPSWVAERFPGMKYSAAEAIKINATPEEGGDYKLAPLLAPEGHLGWAILAGGKRKAIALFSELKEPQPLDILTEEQAIEYGQKAFSIKSMPLKSPAFAWRFSQETPSRFLPFREVRFDEDHTAFVRLDREVFRELSTPKGSL